MYQTSRKQYKIQANSMTMYVCQFEKVYFKVGLEGRETKLMLQDLDLVSKTWGRAAKNSKPQAWQACRWFSSSQFPVIPVKVTDYLKF